MRQASLGTSISASMMWLALAATPDAVHSARLSRVRVLSTSGPLAGERPAPMQAGYTADHFDVQDLVSAVPKLAELAELSGEHVAHGQTMNDTVWLKLGKRLGAVLRDPKVDGVVITHDTDTMEETGYFLSLIVKSDKPVVMVGAPQSVLATSAAGPANLYNAVALAANPSSKGRGVLITIDGEVHFAREAEKIRSAQLDAFRSPNRGRAGLVNTGKAKLWSHLETRFGPHSEFSVEGVELLPRVEIAYTHLNVKRDVVDLWVRARVQGIVLAGGGDTSDELLAGLKEASERGVAVVCSARMGSGLVVRGAAVKNEQFGFIGSEELNPQKARVLLMLGLTKTHDAKELQRYFDQY